MMPTSTRAQRRYDHVLHCRYDPCRASYACHHRVTRPGTAGATALSMTGRPVHELIASGLLSRVLAQTEITFSNSMIESWWRVLKHQWLFLNTLDTVSTVEKLVRFYVQEHNTRLPHSAFDGQTPDEMYFKTGDDIPKQLSTARQKASQARAEANRKQTCSACST